MADGTARGRLSVAADLSLSVGDERVDVWSEADGGTLVVSAPSVGAARRLLAAPSSLPISLDGLEAGLRTAGVAVEVRVRHVPVARLGPGVSQDRLSRLLGPRLGLPSGTAIRPRGLAVAALRRLL